MKGAVLQKESTWLLNMPENQNNGEIQQPPQETDNSNSPAPEETEQQREQIKEMGEIATPNAKHLIHCLNTIGQVEGHYILPPQNKTTKYEHIIPALVAIE